VFECFILVNNPSLYSCKYCYNYKKICESGNSIIADSVKTKLTCFLGQVARYLHQPEDYPLWLKLITEINTTDSLVVLTALYSFTL
jgi:hypothetical protein